MPPAKKRQANLRGPRKQMVEVFNWPAIKQEPELSSAGSSRRSKFNKDESRFSASGQITHEIMLKEEPVDSYEMVIPAEEEQELVAPPPKKQHCIFCFKVVTSAVADQQQQRTTIEFVLGTTLEPSTEAVTCPNCWQMFMLCLQFKRSCLYALSKKDEIAPSVPLKDASEYDAPRKHQSYSNEFILEPLPETACVGSPSESETQPSSPELLLPDDGNDADWRQEARPEVATLPSRDTHLQCMKCNRLFDKFRPFQLHKPSCSGKTKKVQKDNWSNLACRKCHVRFPTLARIKNHLQTFHSPKLQHCPHCTMVFYDEEIYRAHMVQHEGVAKKPAGERKKT